MYELGINCNVKIMIPLFDVSRREREERKEKRKKKKKQGAELCYFAVRQVKADAKGIRKQAPEILLYSNSPYLGHV